MSPLIAAGSPPGGPGAPVPQRWAREDGPGPHLRAEAVDWSTGRGAFRYSLFHLWRGPFSQNFRCGLMKAGAGPAPRAGSCSARRRRRAQQGGSGGEAGAGPCPAVVALGAVSRPPCVGRCPFALKQTTVSRLLRRRLRSSMMDRYRR